MAWAEVVWLNKKAERAKRLIGSQSSIVKAFETKTIAYNADTTVGTFTPKYSGTITIISELYTRPSASSFATPNVYDLVVNGNSVYYVPRQEFSTSASNPTQIYTNINVIEGQTYTITLGWRTQNNDTYYSTISIGAALSESNLVE